MRQNITRALSLIMVVIGIAVIVRTAAAGGSVTSYGYLYGAALVVLGALRLWMFGRMR